MQMAKMLDKMKKTGNFEDDIWAMGSLVYASLHEGRNNNGINLKLNICLQNLKLNILLVY
jgi:hypothetical protein